MANIADQELEKLNTPGRVVEIDRKTAEALGLSFWDYINDRVSGCNRIPSLPDLVSQRLSRI